VEIPLSKATFGVKARNMGEKDVGPVTRKWSIGEKKKAVDFGSQRKRSLVDWARLSAEKGPSPRLKRSADTNS